MICRDLQILIHQYLLNSELVNIHSDLFQEAARREFSLTRYSKEELKDFLQLRSVPFPECLSYSLSPRPLLSYLENIPPSSGNILYCCKYGNVIALEYFLSISLQTSCKEYFEEAIKYNNIGCFQILEKYFEIPPDSSIWAVSYDREEILKYLLSGGIPYITQCHVFYHTISSNKLHLLSLVCPDDQTELHYGLQLSCSEGIDHKIFFYLSEKYKGSYYAFFMKACECGRLDIIQTIFSLGKSDDLSFDLGMIYAARGGYFEIIKFLRLRGCEFAPDAFSASVSSNYPEIVEYFLFNGYRENLEQEFVNACSRSKMKIVNLMIPYLKDVYLSLLKRYGSKECCLCFNLP